jgi:ferredoxin
MRSAHGTRYAHVACAGKLCIEVSPNSKLAWISEELCIGCGICVKVGACVGGCGRGVLARVWGATAALAV